MSVITSVSGFAAFGVLVRTYALGLQKRPLFSNPASHLAAAVAFGGVGYFLNGVVERQTASIEGKKDILLQHRAKAEEIAAKQAAQ